MRILLIAYEFPPIPSPQSLRWAYLVRELAALGHQIRVLAPNHPGYGPRGGLPQIPEDVVVTRTFPGLITWSIKTQARLKRQTSPVPPSVSAIGETDASETRERSFISGSSTKLNWKGRFVKWARDRYTRTLMPDARAEWVPWARMALPRLLDRFQPDVVISSYEPPGPLVLGRIAKRRGHCVVADLGDPVCAPYTPSRWRQNALALERWVCLESDLVTVTSTRTADLLKARHGIACDRMLLLTQGFEIQSESDSSFQTVNFGDQLELLYTGSFYHFRNPAGLISALDSVTGVRLSVASAEVPEVVASAAASRPGVVRLLGFLPHNQVLALQRRADVLINIANQDPVQVPGKLYEYLGAGRPILHIGSDSTDEAATLVRNLQAGWSVPDQADEVAAKLAELRNDIVSIRNGQWPGDQHNVREYAWPALARKLAERISNLDAIQIIEDGVRHAT